MPAYDLAALERIEYDATIDLYRAAPDNVRDGHAIAIRDVAGAACMTSRGIEPASIFRRVVGLGVYASASEETLDSVLWHMNATGLRYVVPVAPNAQPADLRSRLE